MSEKLKKIIVVLLLSIIFISNASNIIKAVYEIEEAYIEKIGEADYHLKYYKEDEQKYTYAICSIVGHYENSKFYPAYCLDRELQGVGTVENYTVDIDKIIENPRIWRAVKNGYPYKTAKEMGLEKDFDAYAVTKYAIYCLNGQADINLYMAEEDDEIGQAMLKELHHLVEIGEKGKETYTDEIKITQMGDLKEDGEYYSIIYKVTSSSTISKYNIESVVGITEGDCITDIEGNEKKEFKSGENFKIKIKKSNLNSDKNINLKIKAELKNYPMFYGKTRITGTQNYLLTAKNYQNIEKSINTNLKLNTGKLVVNKIDAETKNGIEDVEFELYNSENELLEKKQTDKNGKIEFNNLYQGSYILKETKTNEMYVLDENSSYTVEINYNQTTTIDIENKHKKGDLTIYKIDKDDKNIQLENVGFELYNEKTEELVGTYYTDENGKIEIKNLNIGNYKIKEISTNQWYNLAKDTNIQVKWNETTNTTIEDELKKGKVKVIKIDKDNNEIKIPNVEFEVQDISGNVLEKIVTDEKGEAYTKEYPIRDYQKIRIQEVQTPANYKLNNEIIEIELEENNTKEITLENEKKKGQIKVKKVDKDNNEITLEGVIFKIFDSEGNLVDTLTTDENGEALSKLLPIDEDYFLAEIRTLENYILPKGETHIIIEEDEVKEVVIENTKRKGQIKLIKVDKDNEEIKIPNVEFEVTNEKGEVVDKLITDENGEAMSKRLPIDEKYTLKETKTDEKYVLTEEAQTIELQEYYPTEVIVQNEKIKGKIKIVKTASDTSKFNGIKKGEPIEGVIFDIYNSSGEIVDTVTTDSQGIAISKELEKGIYKVRENWVNEWYILDTNYYTLEIKENNQIATLNVKNTPANPDEEIEKTGPDSVYGDEEIEYKIKVQNTGNVPLKNFMWEDKIPTDYIRVTKINLGTYNQENIYNLYYKTNFSKDYILLLEDIDTRNEETIDFSKELAENEYITNIKLDFGTVDVNFKTEKETSIFAKVNSDVKNEEIFENKAILTGKYNGYDLEKHSNWKTVVQKLLPLTGM